MDILFIILLIFASIFIGIFFLLKKRKLPILEPLPETYRQLLQEHVNFYSQLNDVKKREFEKRIELFLSQVRITGIKTEVEALDKVLIAASAIIPIFGFPEWQYLNLHEVLLYPQSFSHDLELDGPHRNTTGMVGTGAYQNIMILSQQELRQDFLNKSGKDNTAIHEFVHLIDKTDGSVDGIPEFIVDKQYIMPWLKLMHREIKQIMNNHSDINPYGATNEAEFFAVVSEYFFERPDLLQIKHPELYNLLVTIFRQRPKNTGKK
ncbi:MAG: zinc-dependent peptidase [Bacteroidia bacterium]|nr:zinc-dependent peptidase [Bacteroidia bacterium]